MNNIKKLGRLIDSDFIMLNNKDKPALNERPAKYESESILDKVLNLFMVYEEYKTYKLKMS